MPGLPLAVPEPVDARVVGPVETSPAQTLFALDSPDLDSPELHELTLTLSEHELSRLKRRAREKGVPVEEFLRSLI